MVKDKKVDWSHLKEVIKIAVRFLDNVIDVNKFPLKDMESTTTLKNSSQLHNLNGGP